MLPHSNSGKLNGLHRCTLSELVLAGIGISLLITGQLLVTDGHYLLSRRFLLDELFTLAIVTDRDLAHVTDVFESILEPNTPALHVLLRGLYLLTGDASEISFHGLTLFCTVFALLGLYTALRKCYGKLPAMIGTLSVWCHPMVLQQAFNARFYALWLALAVWFAVLLRRTSGRERWSWGTVSLAIVSILLCTVHYLGIVSLTLICLGEVMVGRNSFYRNRRVVAAIVSGPIVLFLWICMFYFKQRANVPVIWIPDPSLRQVAQFGIDTLLPAHIAGVVLVAWFSTILDRAGSVALHQGEHPASTIQLAGITSLVLMVPFLIVFAYAVQPILINRYAIVAVACFGPAVAHFASRMGNRWAIVLCIFFLLHSTQQLGHMGFAAIRADQRREELARSIRELEGDDIVVFTSTHRLMPLLHVAPDLSSRCVYFVDQKTQDDRIRKTDVLIVASLNRLYGRPRVVGLEELREVGRCYVVSDDALQAIRECEPSGIQEELVNEGVHRLEWTR
jgi:hypothetical protein